MVDRRTLRVDVKRKRVLLTAALSVATIGGLGAAYVLAPPHSQPLEFPEGKSFAFSIIDDTDGARTVDVRPVYDLLAEAGLRTTKTVWVLPSTDTSRWSNTGESLQDSIYRAFVLDLRDAGFEIASHGASAGGTRREQTLAFFAQRRAHSSSQTETLEHDETLRRPSVSGEIRLRGARCETR